MYKCCYVVVVKAHVKIFYCLLLKCFGGLNKNIFKQFSYQGPLSLTQLLQFFILTKLTFVKKMSTLRNIFPFFIFVAFFSSPINNSSFKGLNDVFFSIEHSLEYLERDGYCYTIGEYFTIVVEYLIIGYNIY